MSGGAMDYAFSRIYDLGLTENDPTIRMLLMDLAYYLRAEEWWLSGDTCKETYVKARKEFKDKWIKLDSKVDVEALIGETIDKAKRELYEALELKWYDEDGKGHDHA